MNDSGPIADRRRHHPRSGRVALVALFAVGALVAACAPPPPPSSGSTTTTSPATTTTLPPPTGPLSCDTDFSTAPTHAAAASVPDPVEGDALAAGVAAAAEASPFGVVEVTVVDETGRPDFYVVTPDRIDEVADGRAITSVEAPAPVFALAATDDPLRPQQWGLDDTNIDAVHHCSTGAGTTVAVVDSGAQISHPDLVGRVNPGPSFLDGGTQVAGGGGVDLQGHGTHVAGTIAATTGNGIGVASVAPDATVYSIRVLDRNGEGWSTDVALGINHAVDVGVDVINLSLGSTSRSGAIRTAVDRAWAEGIVVVAAAGNTPKCSNPCWPGAEPNTIAVAAHGATRQTASFSVNGSWLDVSAPGVGVVSTYPTAIIGSGYASSNGTSFAAPHAAGLAALMVATDASLTPAQVRAALRRGAIDIGAPGVDTKSGHGAIDAAYTWQLHAPN